MMFNDLKPYQKIEFNSIYVDLVVRDSLKLGVEADAEFVRNVDDDGFHINNMPNKFMPYLEKAKVKLQKEFNIDHLEWDTKK